MARTEKRRSSASKPRGLQSQKRACENCRIRKEGCDKKKPICSRCIDKNRSDTCRYDDSVHARESLSATSPLVRPRSDDEDQSRPPKLRKLNGIGDKSYAKTEPSTFKGNVRKSTAVSYGKKNQLEGEDKIHGVLQKTDAIKGNTSIFQKQPQKRPPVKPTTKDVLAFPSPRETSRESSARARTSKDKSTKPEHPEDSNSSSDSHRSNGPDVETQSSDSDVSDGSKKLKEKHQARKTEKKKSQSPENSDESTDSSTTEDENTSEDSSEDEIEEENVVEAENKVLPANSDETKKPGISESEDSDGSEVSNDEDAAEAKSVLSADHENADRLSNSAITDDEVQHDTENDRENINNDNDNAEIEPEAEESAKEQDEGPVETEKLLDNSESSEDEDMSDVDEELDGLKQSEDHERAGKVEKLVRIEVNGTQPSPHRSPIDEDVISDVDRISVDLGSERVQISTAANGKNLDAPQELDEIANSVVMEDENPGEIEASNEKDLVLMDVENPSEASNLNDVDLSNEVDYSRDTDDPDDYGSDHESLAGHDLSMDEVKEAVSQRTGISMPGCNDASQAQLRRLNNKLTTNRGVVKLRPGANDYTLPSRQVGDSLLATYLTREYVIMPIIHVTAFQSRYLNLWTQADGSNDSVVFRGLVNSIFALACLCDNPLKRRKAQAYFSRAQSLVHHGSLDGENTTSLQAYLINTQYFIALGNFDAAWKTVGVAIRVAQTLHLHLHSGNHHLPVDTDQEINKKLWHCCLMLQRIIAINTGMNIPAPPSQVPLPIPTQTDYLDIIFENSPSFLSGPKASSVHFFTASYHLYDIYEDIEFVQEQLRVTPGKEACEILETFDPQRLLSADRRLCDWIGHSPSYLRPESKPHENPMAFRQQNILRARYLYMRIRLWRPLLAIVLTDPDICSVTQRAVDTPLSHSIALEAAAKCVCAALELVQLIEKHERVNKSSDFSGPVPPWWESMGYVFACATVLFAASHCDVVYESFEADSVEKCWNLSIDLLIGYRAFSPVGMTCLNFLEHLVKTAKESGEYEIDPLRDVFWLECLPYDLDV